MSGSASAAPPPWVEVKYTTPLSKTWPSRREKYAAPFAQPWLFTCVSAVSFVVGAGCPGV